MLPAGAFVVAVPPPRFPAGRSGRDSYQAPRARKLGPEQVAVVGAASPGRSLRDLAAEFGVSHETIRAALRLAEPTCSPMVARR